MKTRAIAAALSLSTLTGGAAFAVGVPAASAASASHGPARTAGLSTTTPCTVGGVAQTCTMDLTSFQAVNGVLQAAGSLTTSGGATGSFVDTVTDPAACQILSLTLAPLNLDLLGLVVNIPNPIVLNVTAQPGPGNLLGNLLCAVTNLLNNTGSSANAVANLLNTVNGILAAA